MSDEQNYKPQKFMKLCAYFTGRFFRIPEMLTLEHVTTPDHKKRKLDPEISDLETAPAGIGNSNEASSSNNINGVSASLAVAPSPAAIDIDMSPLPLPDIDDANEVDIDVDIDATRDMQLQKMNAFKTLDSDWFTSSNVRTLEGAHSWPYFALTQAARSFNSPARGTVVSPLRDIVWEKQDAGDEVPDEVLLRHVSDLVLARLKRCEYTTAFSGLDAPGVAFQMIRRTCEAISGITSSPDDPLRDVPRHCCAVEWNRSAMAELNVHPSRPACLFRDIGAFIKEDYQHCNGHELLALMRNGREIVVPFAWCHIHKKNCQHPASDLHVAGTPCVAWSSMGKMEGINAKDFKYFVAWIALRIQLRERLILHEIVPRHKPEILDTMLGEYYDRESVVVCPSQQGWATRRPRRYSLLVLKAEYRRGLDDIHRMGIDSFFLECRRTNDITWQNYMIAGVDDVVKDLQWARGRPSSRANQLREFIGPQTLGDACEQALSRMELTHLHNYWDICGNDRPYTLNQNPTHIAMAGTNTCLHTILRSTSSLWMGYSGQHMNAGEQLQLNDGRGEVGDRDVHRALVHRFMTPFEMLEAQGVPVYSSGMLWARKPRGDPVSSFEVSMQRGRGATCQLAGNTMHVNSVGVALLHILLNFPPPEISEQGHMRKEVSDDVLEFLSVTFEELRHHTSQAARPRPPR